jgi:hypothetical protein
MADETKEGQEKRLSLGLAGPAIWQNNKPDPIPSDVDFTEPIADISPTVIEDVAKNYTQEMLKKGRRDAGTGNQYLPREGYSEAPSHQVGSAVAPPSGDKIFLQDQTNVQATGLGMPSSNSTPGTGEPGQTLGTFFTANQVSAVLDKTGADSGKSGSKLFEKAADISTNTEEQLSKGNVNRPGNEHAADINFTGPFDTLGNNGSKNLSLPGPQDTKGAYQTDNSTTSIVDSVPDQGDLARNQFYPSDRAGKDKDLNDTAQQKIAAGTDDTFFKTDTEMVGIQSTGLGLPSAGDSGQTLGTFFTDSQISEVLDKTGVDPEKSGSKLLEKDSVETVAINTQLQINEGNVNNPDNEHAADIDFTGPLDQLGSNAKDLNYPGDQDVKGAFKSGASKKGLFDLVETAYESDNSTERNPNKPRGPSKTGKSLSSIGSADDFIPPSPGFFAQSTDLTDSPGITPNFFQEKGAPYPTDSPLTADNFDPGAENGVRDQVYAKLEGSNVDRPRSPYIDSAGPDNAIPFDFPDYNETSTANPDKPFVPKETQDKGKHTLDKIEPFKESTALVEDYYKQLEFNAYRPSQPDENNELNYKADTLIQHGGTDGSVWFQADQNTNIDGVVGSSLSDQDGNSLIDKDLKGNKIRNAEADISVKKPGSYLVGKTGPQGQAAEEIYGEIAKANMDPAGVIAAVVKMLQEKNIYTPTEESPFFKGGSTDEDVATQGMFTVQRELGRFVPKSEDPNNTDPTSASGTRVTFDYMKKIGSALPVRPTGDFKNSLGLLGSDQFAISVDNDPLAQIGLEGVDIAKLEIKSMVDGSLDPTLNKILDSARGNDYFMETQKAGKLNTRGVGGEPYSAVSHGQLNNFLEPFGNGVLADSTGMLYIAAISIGTLLSASLLVQAIISNVYSEDERAEPPNRQDPSGMAFGRYSENRNVGENLLDTILYDFLKIPNTDYDFAQCLSYGIPLMLGFPGDIVSSKVGFSLATGQGLIDFALNLVMAPAYYVSYVRTIIKSGQEVNRAFQSTGASFNGGAAQGSEKLFTSLNKLVNSKVYQFLMIAAGVGDANLKSFFGSVGDSQRLYQLKNADIQQDALNPNAALKNSEQAAGIVNAFFGSLIGSVVKSTSMQRTALLRQNVTRWGGPSKNPLSLSTFPASQVADTRVNDLLTNSPLRTLSVEQHDAEWMESVLDAEYMPFYFHDLRTNEIISMPAFVQSFDESFSANYNSVNSYGRQDPVRIYQGTERTINLSFKLVAFSEADYSALWYTVNKFVSMVYPQYSKGVTRQLESAGNTIDFIQPFSQIPAASPLIRIRLGDLFRSNFTDTGLKRLFGYYADSDSKKTTAGDFSVTDITNEKQSALSEQLKIAEKSAIQKFLKQQLAKTGKEKLEAIKNNYLYAVIKENESFLLVNDKKTSSQLQNLAFQNLQPNAAFYKKKGKKLIAIRKLYLKVKNISEKRKGKKYITVTADLGTNDGIEEFSFSKKADVTIKIPISKFETSIEVFKNFNKEKVKDILANDDQVKKLKAEKDRIGISKIANFETVAKDFFKSENNAIVRSFNSTKGKGLAGFITSLAFTYDQSVWETDPKTGRAPKSVDIAISFTPVHDLPLGLDHTGRLRSLSHPVTITGPKGGFGARNANDKPSVNKRSEEANKVREQLSKAARGFDIDGSIL